MINSIYDNHGIATDQITRYKIRTGEVGRRKYSHFYTKHSARKYVAWRMISSKWHSPWSPPGSYNGSYGDPFDPGIKYDTNLRTGKLHSWPCECDPQYGASGCSLHCRDVGYYKELYRRIYRWISKGYVMPGSELMEKIDD